MKKKVFNYVLLAVLVLAGSTKVFAQKSLFGLENTVSDSHNASREGLMRGDVSTGFELGGVTNNENPTADAPIGSGIIVFMVAGVGYALLNRKEDQQ